MRKNKFDYSIKLFPWNCIKFFCISILFNNMVFPFENIPPTTKQLTLQKVLEIKEKGDGKFYFNSPFKISVDKNQNIFLLDNNRILRFSKNGDFISNLVPSGIGPGEAVYLENFILYDNSLIIHSKRMPKIIRKDIEGKILKEARINRKGIRNFISYYKGDYYFLESRFPQFNGDTEGTILDINWNLYAASIDCDLMKPVFSFPVESFFIKIGDSTACDTVAPITIAIIESRYLVINHTCTYKLKIFDLQTKKITKEIGVNYNRREITKEYSPSKYEIDGHKITAPRKKYYNDIRGILIYKNTIWIVTTEQIEKKGTRVDVFDSMGKFKDTFFLNLPGRQDFDNFKACISGNYLYLVEFPDDGEPVIFKYLINY